MCDALKQDDCFETLETRLHEISSKSALEDVRHPRNSHDRHFVIGPIFNKDTIPAARGNPGFPMHDLLAKKASVPSRPRPS
jgi:hypothetical protein